MKVNLRLPLVLIKISCRCLYIASKYVTIVIDQYFGIVLGFSLSKIHILAEKKHDKNKKNDRKKLKLLYVFISNNLNIDQKYTACLKFIVVKSFNLF